MTIVPALTRILEAATSRLLPRAKKAERVKAVVGQAGPELRLSAIARRSSELAELRAASPGALYLWTLLMAQADEKSGGRCKASIGRLCKLAGAARSSVNEWLRILVEKDFATTQILPFVSRTRTVMMRYATPKLPAAVDEAETAAKARGKAMEKSTGDDVVSKNRHDEVFLRKAIVPLERLTQPDVRAAAASGQDFHVWLWIQAQTWARAVRMTSRWIATQINLLSTETRKDRELFGGAKVRVALAHLVELGLASGEGARNEPKVWRTPETLDLPSSGPMDQTDVVKPVAAGAGVDVDHEPYAARILDEWFGHLDRQGVRSTRRSATATEDELALARRMALALKPLDDTYRDDADPLWLSDWWSWVYGAWHNWKSGERPVMLTALAATTKPPWIG